MQGGVNVHFGVVAFPPSLPAPPPFSPGKGWHRSETPPTVFLSSLPIRDFYTAVFKSSTRLWLSVPGAQEGSSLRDVFPLPGSVGAWSAMAAGWGGGPAVPSAPLAVSAGNLLRRAALSALISISCG